MADFLPRRDADLVTWARCFATHIAAEPSRYGLTEADAAEFADVEQAFAQAHQVANSPATRTEVSIIAKDEARSAMKVVARRLARIVHATPGVTDEMKIGLGLALHRAGRRRTGLMGLAGAGFPGVDNPGAGAPRLRARSMTARRVRLTLRDGDSLRVGKPRGVMGAMIFSQVGDRPSMRPGDWTFVCNTTRTGCQVALPAGLEPGTKVWFTAAWVDSLLQPGRWSAPAMVYVQFDVALPGSTHLPAIAA